MGISSYFNLIPLLELALCIPYSHTWINYFAPVFSPRISARKYNVFGLTTSLHHLCIIRISAVCVSMCASFLSWQLLDKISLKSKP